MSHSHLIDDFEVPLQLLAIVIHNENVIELLVTLPCGLVFPSFPLKMNKSGRSRKKTAPVKGLVWTYLSFD